MSLGNRLRVSRQDKGLSQAFVAEYLNISRQSISRWENDKGYPDIDNLVSLSELYEVSIDRLLKENEELKKKIEQNEETIKKNRNNLKRIKEVYSGEKDEGLLLLIMAIAACAAAPLGLIVAPAIIIKNKKSNSCYILVNIVCVLCFFISAYFLWISIGDRLNWEGHTEVIFTPEDL